MANWFFILIFDKQLKFKVMYRGVEELTSEELNELRSRLYHQMMDDGSLEEVFETEINDDSEIPMDFVKSHYSDTSFVEEDFFCNNKEDMETILLPIGGIEITLFYENDDNGKRRPIGGNIKSDLKVGGEDEYNIAIDAIESLVLAQAVAEIDVLTPEYIQSLETTIDAITNNI